MYDCCPCCADRVHVIGHADPCSKHQRAEAAERAKHRRRRARTVETVELPEDGS